MKKVFLIGFLAIIAASCSKQESLNNSINSATLKSNESLVTDPAVLLMGFGLEFEKGIRQWSPDGSTAQCIGYKKVCKFKISIDLPIPFSLVTTLPVNQGGVIFYDGNNLFIAFPDDVLTDPIESDMFSDGAWQLTGDVYFSPNEQIALGPDAPNYVSAGAYPYSVSNGMVIIEL